MFGRSAGMGGMGRAAAMLPMSQPQYGMQPQPANPWETQQRNLGMMGPNMGMQQRGIGPTFMPNKATSAGLSAPNRKISPARFGQPNMGMGQPPLPQMGIGPRRPPSYEGYY